MSVVPIPAAESGGTAERAPRRLSRVAILRLVSVALAVVLWFAPVPGGLTPPAWHLFALFAVAIVSVVIGSFPILRASVVALAVAVLTGTIPAARAWSGFSNGTILLIVVAFL